jgi:hypothetical protein
LALSRTRLERLLPDATVAAGKALNGSHDRRVAGQLDQGKRMGNQGLHVVVKLGGEQVADRYERAGPRLAGLGLIGALDEQLDDIFVAPEPSQHALEGVPGRFVFAITLEQLAVGLGGCVGILRSSLVELGGLQKHPTAGSCSAGLVVQQVRRQLEGFRHTRRIGPAVDTALEQRRRHFIVRLLREPL